jgi:hypothetical protein
MSSAGMRYTIRKHSNGTVSVIDGTTGDVAQVSGALLIGLSWELATDMVELLNYNDRQKSDRRV